MSASTTKRKRKYKNPPRPGQPMVSALVKPDVQLLARLVAAANRTSLSALVRDGLNAELRKHLDHAVSKLDDNAEEANST